MSKTPKNKKTICTIYKLICPLEDGLVKYIGKTVKPLRTRFKEHLWEADKYHLKSHKSNWIRKLKKLNLIPIIEMIETCFWEQSQEKEKYWISYYKKLNSNLCNETEGGEGNLGRIMTQETKDKISKSHKKISVFCYTKDFKFISKFISIQDAARKTQSSASKIVACCKKKRNFHNNLIWSYNEI